LAAEVVQFRQGTTTVTGGHVGDQVADVWTKDRWAVLLTNKLYYTRDRGPLTEVRKAFRELAFN
jgi:hypothetical protein